MPKADAAASFKDVAVSPTYLHRLVAAEGDMDALGHVSNIVYLRWVQDAATAHSDAVGWDYDKYKALGSVWVVRKHEITYLQPAYAGDEIECETWIASFRGASSPRRTRVLRQKDGAELARVITLWALIDMQSGRPRRIPAEMLEDFQREPRRAE